MFKIPLNFNEDLFYDILKNKSYAHVLEKVVCFIWDDIPMQYYYYIKIVDKTLKGINGTTNFSKIDRKNK